MCLVRLEDNLEANFMAVWRRMRQRNQKGGVTHYELTFNINEDDGKITVRNAQKDIATNSDAITDTLNFLGVNHPPA